jgi:acetone carboxylase gamma subunit
MPHDTERTELRIDRLKDRLDFENELVLLVSTYLYTPASSFAAEGEERW